MQAHGWQFTGQMTESSTDNENSHSPFCTSSNAKEFAKNVLRGSRPDSPPHKHRGAQLFPSTMSSHEDQSISFSDIKDPKNGLQTRIATGPPHRITDPALYQRGVHAHRKIFGSKVDNEAELFFPKFRVQDSSFFSVGAVLLYLWPDVPGNSSTIISSVEVGDSGKAFAKVRRYVVVRTSQSYSSVLPITTYGGRGVAKRGVIKSEHGIVYTGTRPPEPGKDELPSRGEAAMRHRPIRVVPKDPTAKLDSKARVNFGKVTTMEHSVRVNSFGYVHPDSLEALVSQFNNVFTPPSASTYTSQGSSRSFGSDHSDGTQRSSDADGDMAERMTK